ncbi:hypothetical protein BDM02DRAFT_3270138 [Thelephora ganbajun]|uniref:Uncharacterized protein n=1 Tax=Thelephora ganbajun TaxID=370292 RepID=A0ACB6ZDG6_THEGA|nr:hypothetical protein BDM02DRAFT_3270138 [Thelephora ganbajun]
MDTERPPLSCPGRVQDWLGAAADQIETLLQVPLPSLSGSDQAIGALRIKRERPSHTTGPYNLQPTNLVSGAFPVTYQLTPSVSSDWSQCGGESPSRCENCVAEKRSRCSRDLPSCTRCRKNGLLCFYLEGVPTGRRKPQGRTRQQSRVKEGASGLPVESFLAAPISKDPALLETGGALVTLHHHQDAYPLHAVSEYVQSLLEKHTTVPPVGYPRDSLPAGNLKDSQHQTVVAKRQTTMLPATPNFSILPHRTSKLETARQIARVELHSNLLGAVSSTLNPTSLRRIALAAAAKSLCQDPGSEDERKALENVLQKCTDNEIQKHAAHLAALPLQSQIPSHRQTSAASSLDTTPFASALASRSTSRSSGTDSLPITPATELPTPPNKNNAQRTVGANIPASQISSVPHTSSAFHETSVTDDVEARLLYMEQLVDLYLLSHHRHETTCDTVSGADSQDKSFSDGFVEELFEEGDAAKKLVELQRHPPGKRKISLRS